MKCTKKINPTAQMELVKVVTLNTQPMVTQKRHKIAPLSKAVGRVAQYG